MTWGRHRRLRQHRYLFVPEPTSRTPPFRDNVCTATESYTATLARCRPVTAHHPGAAHKDLVSPRHAIMAVRVTSKWLTADTCLWKGRRIRGAFGVMPSQRRSSLVYY